MNNKLAILGMDGVARIVNASAGHWELGTWFSTPFPIAQRVQVWSGEDWTEYAAKRGWILPDRDRSEDGPAVFGGLHAQPDSSTTEVRALIKAMDGGSTKQFPVPDPTREPTEQEQETEWRGLWPAEMKVADAHDSK